MIISLVTILVAESRLISSTTAVFPLVFVMDSWNWKVFVFSNWVTETKLALNPVADARIISPSWKVPLILNTLIVEVVDEITVAVARLKIPLIV